MKMLLWRAIKAAAMPAWAVAFIAAGVLAALPSPASAHGVAVTYQCTTTTLQVVVPGDAGESDVVGKLCSYGSPLGKPLQFTVAGLSYTGDTYWDNDNPQYSYARAAALAGFAVYVYDQVGSGGASTNPATGVSLLGQADIMHQLIVQIRAGAIVVKDGGKNKPYTPTEVIVAGHSLGAEQAMVLGSTPAYMNDADAYVLQSFLHVANPVGAAQVAAVRVPALTTTKYAALPWAAGYVTTADGHRDVFYYTPNADPAVIAADEATKGVASIATAVQANYMRVNTELTKTITKPVLLVTGEFDILNCDAAVAGLSCASSAAVKLRESQYYAGSACFTAYTIKGFGHDVNLHRRPAASFATQNAWALAALYTPGLLKHLGYC